MFLLSNHIHSSLTCSQTNTPAVIRPATVPVASQLSPILLSSSLRPTLSSSSSPSQDFHLYASTHASERSQMPPRPNRISSNAPSTPDLWKAKIDRQSSGQGTSIDITAPDPNQAALALISLIMKHHNQGPDPDYPIPAGVQVDAFSYDDLVGGQRRWYMCVHTYHIIFIKLYAHKNSLVTMQLVMVQNVQSCVQLFKP